MPRFQIHLHLVYPSGASVAVVMDSEDDVSHLKRAAVENAPHPYSNIPERCMKLKYMGVVLENDTSVVDIDDIAKVEGAADEVRVTYDCLR